MKRGAGAERRIGTESGMDRARGARVEAYGIARVRGRAVPLAAPPCPPRRASRYRGAFTRPARWHGASARSRPAQRAGTPQQWSQRAITPRPRPLRVVSSRLGRLYVSCATCRCSDVGRPPTREGAVLPRRPRVPSAHQAHAKQAHKKRPAPRGCGPTKAGCESISRRWK